MLNTILSALSNPSVIMVVAMLVEGVFHLIPSTKPLGLLHGASAILSKVSQITGAAASFLDKVLPQNITPAAVAAQPTEPPSAG